MKVVLGTLNAVEMFLCNFYFNALTFLAVLLTLVFVLTDAISSETFRMYAPCMYLLLIISVGFSLAQIDSCQIAEASQERFEDAVKLSVITNIPM